MKNKISKYFFSGLLTALPLIITYQIIKTFAGVIREFIPNLNILIAFLLSVILMILLGFIVNKLLSKRIRAKLNKKSKESGIVGGISSILLNLKILSEQTKNIFKNPIVYKVDDGIYRLGYISNKSFAFLQLDEEQKNEATPSGDSVWVFSPSPINFSGSLHLVEMRKIQKLEGHAKEDISLFILTAGVSKNEQ